MSRLLPGYPNPAMPTLVHSGFRQQVSEPYGLHKLNVTKQNSRFTSNPGSNCCRPTELVVPAQSGMEARSALFRLPKLSGLGSEVSNLPCWDTALAESGCRQRVKVLNWTMLSAHHGAQVLPSADGDTHGAETKDPTPVPKKACPGKTCKTPIDQAHHGDSIEHKKSLTGIPCLVVTSRCNVESMCLSAPLGLAVAIGQASEGRCVSSVVGYLTRAHHLLDVALQTAVLRRCLGALPCTPVRETPAAHGRTPHEGLELQV